MCAVTLAVFGGVGAGARMGVYDDAVCVLGVLLLGKNQPAAKKTSVYAGDGGSLRCLPAASTMTASV